MIDIEHLPHSESVDNIPDIILVDNNYGIGSPDVLSRGVELALRFGFDTLYVPDLSKDEITKINEYRQTPQDDLRKEINKILRKTFSRNREAIEAYWEIIASGIILEGNSKKSKMLSHDQKSFKDEIEAKIAYFRLHNKRVIIFTSPIYNSFLEEKYEFFDQMKFFRFKGAK